MAFRLTRFARGHWGWVLMAVAMVFMALRRLLGGWEIMAGHRAIPNSEWLSLAISVLMVVGMVGVGGLLRAGHRAEQALKEAEKRAETEGERAALHARQAQDALERQESFKGAADLGRWLASMVDSTDLWISILDKDGRVVAWNRAAEEISGYSRNEMLGRSDFWEMLYPDSGVRMMLAFEMEAMFRRGERTRGQETTLTRKDGAVRTVSWYICPVVGEGAEFGGSFAIGIDVSEDRENTVDLTQIRTFQNLILDNTALGLSLVRDRKHCWINAKGAEILGISAVGADGAPTRANFPDERSYQDFKERAANLLSQGGYADMQVRLRRPNGTFFWCRLVGKALDPARVKDGTVWMIEDVTSRMGVETALAESEERFRGAFEGTLDALLLMTPKAIFDCNQQTLRTFGFDGKSEILQKGLRDLSPSRQPGGKDSGEELSHHLQCALVGESARFNWTFHRRGAGDFQAEVYLNAFPMGRRNVVLACVRPTQAAVQGIRDLDWEVGIRVFLDRNPTATMIIDTENHRFVYCNRAVLTMLRCRTDEVYGMKPEDLSPPYQPDGRSSRDFVTEMNAIALHGGSHRFRHVHRSPHREDFTVDVTLTALQPGYSPLLVVNWAEVTE